MSDKPLSQILHEMEPVDDEIETGVSQAVAERLNKRPVAPVIADAAKIAEVPPANVANSWQADGHGVKQDTDKLPWHLVPFDAVGAIGRVLQFGAGKYAPRNWERGMNWSRVFSALMRHLTVWWGGEAKDPETGFSHLWHAGCCVLFLIAFELRGIGKDDRPNSEAKAAP